MKIDVLDHGYVRFIEAWGHGEYAQLVQHSAGHTETVRDMEAGIIEAARQSTQGSFRGWDQDAKLLEHLYTNQHMTPFEQAGMTIEVQAPIFVFREWHRHRTQSYNEMSARYAPLPDLYYTPTVDRCVVPQTDNKQAATVGGLVANPDDVEMWRFEVTALYAKAEKLYQRALMMGVPKEVARITMPVGHYSRMRASANLRNWLAFMTLRCAPNAQYEIRQFADAVGQIIAETFPRTHNLWVEEVTGV